MVEILGYIASVIVLISFLMKDMMKLRIINTVACMMFVVYGILLGAIPVVVTNIMVITVNLHYIIKNNFKK